MVRPLNPPPEPLFIFRFNARAAQLRENRIIMLRANYIHYIAIYSVSAPSTPKSWVVWVSFGSGLGAVWVKANPLLLLHFSDKYIYIGTKRFIHVSHFAECFSPTLGIKSLL